MVVLQDPQNFFCVTGGFWVETSPSQGTMSSDGTTPYLDPSADSRSRCGGLPSGPGRPCALAWLATSGSPAGTESARGGRPGAGSSRTSPLGHPALEPPPAPGADRVCGPGGRAGWTLDVPPARPQRRRWLWTDLGRNPLLQPGPSPQPDPMRACGRTHLVCAGTDPKRGPTSSWRGRDAYDVNWPDRWCGLVGFGRISALLDWCIPACLKLPLLSTLPRPIPGKGPPRSPAGWPLVGAAFRG